MAGVQPLSSQLSQVSGGLYSSSNMAREQAYGSSSMNQPQLVGYQIMPPDPFGGSPSGMAYEMMMQGNRARASIMGAQAFTQAATQQQDREFMVNLGAAAVATAAAAIPAGFLASSAVYFGAEAGFSAAAKELGWMDQDPVVTYEDQMRAMVSGTVHQLAFQNPLPGHSRGVSMGTANAWGGRIYDQMQDAGFQGAEIGRIGSILQQSGAFEGIDNYEQMLSRLEQYITRIAEFAKTTGASLEQVGQFMGLSATSGATPEEMLGTVNAIQNVAYRTDIPGEQLMQMGAQALGPWSSMGVNYNPRAQSILANIGSGHDAMMTSGASSMFRQAGGWEQVAFGYEAAGSQVMSSNAALTWLGAGGPGAINDMLSGGEMGSDLQNRISGMSRQDRALSAWRGTQIAALNPDQWGDINVAQQVGSLERAGVTEFDAVSWEMYQAGGYASPAAARAALTTFNERTDPAASMRFAVDIHRDRQMLEVTAAQSRALRGLATVTALGGEDRGGNYGSVVGRVSATPEADYATAFADVDNGRYLAAVQAATQSTSEALGSETTTRGQANVQTLISMINNEANPQAKQMLVAAAKSTLVGAEVWGIGGIGSDIAGAHITSVGLGEDGNLQIGVHGRDTYVNGRERDIVLTGDMSDLDARRFGGAYINDELHMGGFAMALAGSVDSLMGASEQVDLSQLGASGSDRLILETLSAQGRSGLFATTDAMSADNGLVRAERVLRFSQEQMAPTELRDTYNLIHPSGGNDPAWNDLKSRLENNSSSWNVEGLNSSNPDDRFAAIDRFVKSVYGNDVNGYDQLDPEQKRAVNYYVGTTYPEWGASDQDMLTQATANVGSLAMQAVQQAGAREALQLSTEDREAGMRRMRMTTGLNEGQLGAISEYMFLQNERNRLSGMGELSEEQNARLADVTSRMEEMNRDTSMFEGSNVGVASEQYGAMVQSVGASYSTDSALVGSLAVTQGSNLLQAHNEMVAQVTGQLGIAGSDSAVVSRMISGQSLTPEEINMLESKGAATRLIDDLRADQKLDDFDILEQEYNVRVNRGDAAATGSNNGTTSEGLGSGTGGDPGNPMYVSVVDMAASAAFRNLNSGESFISKIWQRAGGGRATPTDEESGDS